jgi:hypothetical protein
MRRILLDALLVTALFAGMIGLIHAQPYEDHDLRAFLQPEGCAAPCFMDIRPGATRADAAYLILEHHPWVSEIHAYADFGVIAWTWSGRQPDWIDASKTGTLSITRGMVYSMQVYSKIPFGDIWLMYGNPITYTFVQSEGAAPASAFAILDAHFQYIVGSAVMCQRRFWNAAVQISIRADELSSPDQHSRLPGRAGYRAFCA